MSQHDTFLVRLPEGRLEDRRVDRVPAATTSVRARALSAGVVDREWRDGDGRVWRAWAGDRDAVIAAADVNPLSAMLFRVCQLRRLVRRPVRNRWGQIRGWAEDWAWLFPDGARVVGWNGVTWAEALGDVANSPAFVAATQVGASGSSATPLVYSVTVAAGTDRLLTVGVVYNSGGPATTVTFGAAGLSLVAQEDSGAQGTNAHADAYLYALIAPAEATADVTVNTLEIAGRGTSGAMRFTGVHQTTPLGTPSLAFDGNTSATGLSVTVADSAADDLVIDTLGRVSNNEASVATQTDQTLRWDIASGAASCRGSGSTRPATGAHTVMGWSWTTAGRAAMVGVAIKPAAAPAGGLPPGLVGGMTGGMQDMTGGLRG